MVKTGSNDKKSNQQQYLLLQGVQRGHNSVKVTSDEVVDAMTIISLSSVYEVCKYWEQTDQSFLNKGSSCTKVDL
jgi:hypothetical protein